MTATSDTSTAEPGPPRDRPHASSGRDNLLSAFVGQRAGELQRGYLADLSSAVQQLAVLRRALGTAPGADPGAWAAVFRDMPAPLLGHGDAPSQWERAAHDALTVFAVHQQGRREPMHRSGASVGGAARALGEHTAAEGAVRRRFEALGTASTPAETLHHLRGLVTQLRGAGLALDHGALARDLRRLGDPRRADGVRLAWGRDYHRTPTTPCPTHPAPGEQ